MHSFTHPKYLARPAVVGRHHARVSAPTGVLVLVYLQALHKSFFKGVCEHDLKS